MDIFLIKLKHHNSDMWIVDGRYSPEEHEMRGKMDRCLCIGPVFPPYGGSGLEFPHPIAPGRKFSDRRLVTFYPSCYRI